ncbi:MAG: hypothetical protein AB4062_01210 [Crocosphaera sp.]
MFDLSPGLLVPVPLTISDPLYSSLVFPGENVENGDVLFLETISFINPDEEETLKSELISKFCTIENSPIHMETIREEVLISELISGFDRFFPRSIFTIGMNIDRDINPDEEETLRSELISELSSKFNFSFLTMDKIQITGQIKLISKIEKRFIRVKQNNDNRNENLKEMIFCSDRFDFLGVQFEYKIDFERNKRNNKMINLIIKLLHEIRNQLIRLYRSIFIRIVSILESENFDIFFYSKDFYKKLNLVIQFNKIKIILDKINTIINTKIKIINISHILKEKRKYRKYFTLLKYINSDNSDSDKSKHLIISLTVLNSSKRQKITFTFSKLLTAINRLKKDDGEIRNDIPQYWPSSKYRKKRIFEPNHRINCLLQTQFYIRQTLSSFYSSYEFSVSRIC